MLRLGFAVTFASLVLASPPAAANTCALANPVVDVYEVPVGCPVVAHTSQSFSYPFEQPAARATRILAGGATETLDVTGTITRTTTTHPIDYYFYEDATSCELQQRTQDEVFDTVTLELNEVIAGDQIDLLDGGDRRASVTVVATGPCPPPDVQTLACAQPIQPCEVGGIGDDDDDDDGTDDGDGGCAAAGSGGSLGVAFALFALARRRPR